MNQRKIFITDFDKKRLDQMISNHLQAYNPELKYLTALQGELNRAEIVSSERIPQDVVTMNSKVTVQDIETGEASTYTLVFPAAADASQDKISILAPIGTAIIGYRVGDAVEWEVPAGIRKLKVTEIIYQPEAAGDYHL
jgi:regulator of nucleoside diphosphate kinase